MKLQRTQILILSKGVIRSIEDVLNTEAESCGFLIGHASYGGIYGNTLRLATNLYKGVTSIAFAINHNEYQEALRNNTPEEQLIAIFHTHHGPAVMSKLDQENIKIFPFIWLIIGFSIQEGRRSIEWRCFAWSGRRIDEIPVQIN